MGGATAIKTTDQRIGLVVPDLNKRVLEVVVINEALASNSAPQRSIYRRGLK